MSVFKIVLAFFLTLLLHVGALPYCHAQNEKIHVIVEEMPRFPGCETMNVDAIAKKKCADKALRKFIRDNIQYPEQAAKKRLKGAVLVQFIVEKNGQISNLKVIRDIGGGCGNEALRVLRMIQENNMVWEPGYREGEPVRVRYTLPVKFKPQRK
jgi:protein TonB